MKKINLILFEIGDHVYFIRKVNGVSKVYEGDVRRTEVDDLGSTGVYICTPDEKLVCKDGADVFETETEAVTECLKRNKDLLARVSKAICEYESN